MSNTPTCRDAFPLSAFVTAPRLNDQMNLKFPMSEISWFNATTKAPRGTIYLLFIRSDRVACRVRVRARWSLSCLDSIPMEPRKRRQVLFAVGSEFASGPSTRTCPTDLPRRDERSQRENHTRFKVVGVCRFFAFLRHGTSTCVSVVQPTTN